MSGGDIVQFNDICRQWVRAVRMLRRKSPNGTFSTVSRTAARLSFFAGYH